MTSTPQTDIRRETGAAPGPVAWIALAVLFFALTALLSIVQPLARTPDEAAHMQYVQFIAGQQRLPIFAPVGGGEAGYEAQHPPLYYALMALPYALTAGLEEHWRWHVLRWLTALLVGGGGFLVSRAFFLRLWPDAPRVAFLGTAVTMLMPLTILYSGYINPDGFAFLMVSIALYLALLTAREEPSLVRAALLGLTIGAASLTKISALIAVVPAAVAWVYLARGGNSRAWLRDAAVSLVIALAVGAWWYARNLMYYGSPFIHTAAPYGSALDNAFASGRFGFLAWLAARETFLSTWIQRGWLPGPAEWLFYGLVIVLVVGAVVAWIAQRREATDEPETSGLRAQGAVLSVATLIAVVLGQQSAFWLSDVEFNAGGRYVLMAMPGIVHIMLGGWSRLVTRRALIVIFACFAAAVVVANLLSAWNIVTVLNPRYAPGWQVFHFPPG